MIAASVRVGLAVTLAGGWGLLAPGLEHRAEEHVGVTTEALRIDLGRFTLDVVVASALGQTAATAGEFAAATGAVAAWNGGFFDPDGRPLGLRLSRGRKLAGPASRRLAALVVFDDRLEIRPGDALGDLGAAAAVLQCGPRLVIGGQPNRLKPQLARRTVMGVDRVGRVVVLVTRAGILGARELAEQLSRPEGEGGYGLVQALNLDGGASTQLFLRLGDRLIDVPGVGGVSDAVVLKPREPSQPAP